MMNYRYGEKNRAYDYETLLVMNKNLCKRILQLEEANRSLAMDLDDALQGIYRIDITREGGELVIDLHGASGEIYLNGVLRGTKIASNRWVIRWKIEGIKAVDDMRKLVRDVMDSYRDPSKVFEVRNKLGG